MEIEKMDPATGERRLSPEFESVLADLYKRHRSDQDEAEREKRPATVAVSQAGVLSGLSDLQFFGIPVGEALGGGAVAFIVGEVLQGVLGDDEDEDNQVMRGVVKLIAGGALVTTLSGFLGPGLARAGAMFLAFDAARDIFPVDNLIRDLLGIFRDDENGDGNGASNQLAAGQDLGELNGGRNGSMSEEDMLDMAAARAAA